jgi:hypothetical protein
MCVSLAETVCLENRRGESSQEFESLHFLQIQEYRTVASTRASKTRYLGSSPSAPAKLLIH